LAIDREDTLKKAEKFLRQGRLDSAIAEYLRVVEDQPRDWATINTLGDLFVRAGQADKAAAQYQRIADHFMREGFFPKAAALYKKILKIRPEEEAVQLQLAEISARQGLIADARSYYTAVAERRRSRGDRRGASEITVRLGDLDPNDVEARTAAARAVAELGDEAAAAERFRALAADLLERDREAESLDALREAARLDPADTATRTRLAKAALAKGDLEQARFYLDRGTAGDDPDLLFPLAEIELKGGQLEEARGILSRLLEIDPARRDEIVQLSWTLAGTHGDAASACVELAADAAVAAGDYTSAAAALDEFVNRVPGRIPVLLKLVEICVDGGLESTMYMAQAQLADAYLAAGQPAEARVIAEDLVAREPWEHAHIERFRQALLMLRVPDPDTVIAERLSGQAPFTATDPFVDPEDLAPDRLMAAVAAPAPSVAAPSSAAPPAPPAPVDPEPAPPASVPPPRPAAQQARPEPPLSTPADGVFDLGRFDQTEPRAARTGPMEIDLTGVLRDLKAPAAAPARQASSLDEAFSEFRSEVSRHTGADASAEQLKVGRTCLEMGMLDEAVKALEVAARAPRLRFEAGSLLALVHKKRNDLLRAVEWLERAAEAPAPGAGEGHALLYDLASTLESLGETARALAVFMELQADAPGYRDVAARVDRLAKVQTGG
jgi:tetratricopeptide (TPR) repeat protein